MVPVQPLSNVEGGKLVDRGFNLGVLDACQNLEAIVDHEVMGAVDGVEVENAGQFTVFNNPADLTRRQLGDSKLARMYCGIHGGIVPMIPSGGSRTVSGSGPLLGGLILFLDDEVLALVLYGSVAVIVVRTVGLVSWKLGNAPEQIVVIRLVLLCLDTNVLVVGRLPLDFAVRDLLLDRDARVILSGQAIESGVKSTRHIYDVKDDVEVEYGFFWWWMKEQSFVESNDEL
ncbi:hypothetical protein PG988_006138 [Apiospora saccharicola]